MQTIKSAARGGAAALLFIAAAACSNNSQLGDILGGVLGNGGSQVTGQINGVNTRYQTISLTQNNGQSVTLNYDNNTRVVYQDRNYTVSNLEYGDNVTARVTNGNNSNGYYTDLIEVNQSATNNTGGGVYGNVQNFEGTVRNLDRTNGVFTLTGTNAGSVTVTMPYNPRSADVNKFNSLRNGDYVRLQGTLLNNSRVELRNFY
jgi:hypothetical protein